MRRIFLALENLFQRQLNGEDVGLAFDRISREISGVLFALISIFLLVALVSYLPLDSFNIFQGRFDHLNNLGGIVGALISEWFLGTLGVAGYSIIVLAAWLSYCGFRGISFRDNLLKIFGFLLATALLSVTVYLLLNEHSPEASLLQGGYVGKHVGSTFQRLFSMTGSLLILGGSFLATAILTFGFSFSRGAARLFDSDEVESAPEQMMERPKPIPRKVIPFKKAEPPKKTKKKKAKTEDDTVELDTNLNPMMPPATTDEESGDDSSNIIDLQAPQPPIEGFQPLVPYTGPYQHPTARLLKGDSGNKKTPRGELISMAKKLCEHLLSFDITGEIVAISQGPVLNTFEFKPDAGIKLKAIAAVQEDLGIALGTRELRIIAPIPGKTVVGIEVPKTKADVISLKEIISADEFYDKKLKIPVALGKTTDGKPIFTDLTSMPHLIVAGSTGSGKSVFINSLIMSMIYRLSPQQLRLILVDPKMLELNVFGGLPHLITDVITNNAKAYNALEWAVEEMDRRYQLMAETGSKNIESYNSKMKSSHDKLPFIVIVVDELADLMMSGGQMVEVAITRLAQKARAAGIHLVIATQRPSTDVITGLIKANVPSRIAFKVPSSIDSRTILDTSGAEELIGKGDSLMILSPNPVKRVHGCFVTEDELARVVKFVKNNKRYNHLYIDFSDVMPDKK